MVRLAVVLALTAAGALAVAGFRQSDSPTPISQLVENVNNITLDSQISSLDKDRLRLYRSDTSRSTDTAESMLSRLGVSDKTAADFMRGNPLVREALLGKARAS